MTAAVLLWAREQQGLDCRGGRGMPRMREDKTGLRGGVVVKMGELEPKLELEARELYGVLLDSRDRDAVAASPEKQRRPSLPLHLSWPAILAMDDVMVVVGGSRRVVHVGDDNEMEQRQPLLLLLAARTELRARVRVRVMLGG
jgi:hypothetical protein